MLTRSCTGPYHNQVTFSFTPNYRFGDKVNNCNMAYYSKTVTIRSFLKFSYLLMAKVRVCSPEEK